MQRSLPAIKGIFLGLITLLMVTAGYAQAQFSQRVFLLGNTGDLPANSQVYQDLRTMINRGTTPATVIINGDITDGAMNFHEDSLKLAQMLSVVEGLQHVKLIIIPGDRDWGNSGPQGLKYVRRLENLVNSFNVPNVQWALKKGCPGPMEIALNDQLLLIAIQTQWWNHPFDKPQPADADCRITSQDNFNEELEDLIEENGDKNILVAGHFPIISKGPYGGKWPLSKYLLPIPVLSGLYPSFRSNVGTPRDIHNKRFQPLRHELMEMLQEQHGLIYFSSHEHNLQLLRFQDHHLINSGSITDPGYTGKAKDALYAKSQAGLVELRYFPDGSLQAVIQGYEEDHLQELKQFTLYRSTCQDSQMDGSPFNTRYIPCGPQEITENIPPDQLTSINIQAGAEYQATSFKQNWLGRHYRDSWTMPVKVPYLNLDSTFQGLTPIQKGGGRQTTSLKFQGGNGGEYVFRSVNKDPTKALDFQYRETIVGSVVRDQTSAQQPYGALAADVLLNKLDILHAHPRLYVLPNSKQLGSFRDYGGLLGMLEERPANPGKTRKPFENAHEVLKSYRMFHQLYEDHDHRVDTREFARARTFDLLVGDWGKHEDNWKWAGFEDEKGMIYRPIPRDRDHVFSLWDGILPWLADREWAKPSAANFGYEYTGIRSLMWQARHLDRFLGNQLTRHDWIDAAKFIRQNIGEQDIEEAIRSMPPEIYQGDGKIIAEKLNSRLKMLDQAASDYYDLLARYVDVVGSNKRERFLVNRAQDGSVEVAVVDLDEAGDADSSRIYYHRKFLPGETREIRLYGLQKADQFYVYGKAKKSIPVRIVGGPGADEIMDQSEIKGWTKHTKIYEKGDGPLELGTEGKQITTWNESVYNYNRTAFAYNTYFPLAYILYSKDFGLGIRTGVLFTRQKFGKQEYASKHALQLALSAESIKVLNYQGRFHQVLGKWDITLGGLAADHYYFTYFFGIGNDTPKDDGLYNDDYYRTSFSSYQLTTGLAREFWPGNGSQLAFKIQYENNVQQIGENTILSDPENNQEIPGIRDTNLWEAEINLDLDFRDRQALPEKGMRVFLQHQSGILTTENNADYGVSQGFLEGYVSAYLKRPLTLGVKAGASTSYGQAPFYKLKYLGQNNDLRGYLRNRFTGESTLFLNTELRWEIAEFQTSVFPLRLGLKAFFDSGRVYSKYDLTGNWHHGYGGGFYVIPLKEEISLNISMAFSEEESGLLLIAIGRAF